MGQHPKGFRADAGPVAGAWPRGDDRQLGRGRDGLSGRPGGGLFAGLFYAGMGALMRAGVAVHFRRAHVLARERVPASGALLLAANHPSTWSDALLLERLLGRRFHFLAEVGQFRPWPRAVFIRLFGTLPVRLPVGDGDAAALNEETFRLCHALFDRGEAVAIFPEGLSRDDRSLIPLKRGAAHLALSYARRLGAAPSFALLPVAIRYADRTAFRSDVTLCVGEPIPLPELRAALSGDEASDEIRLTERIAGEFRVQGALARDSEEGALLGVLETAVAPEGKRPARDAARALLGSIAALRRSDPDRLAELRRLARAHARAVKALRVSGVAFARGRRRPAARRAARAALLAAATVPALAGALLHAVPVALTGAALRFVSRDPSRIAFARITAGFFFLALTYVSVGVVLARVLGAGPFVAAAALAASAALGAIALRVWDEARPALERRRIAWIARRHPELVDRARRNAASLQRWVDALLRRPEGSP